MSVRLKVQIKGRDPFWSRAFHVEWQDQFPDRQLVDCGSDCYLADEAWLDDLRRVGEQTRCEVLRAPDNPGRRDWLGSLLPRVGRK